MKRHTSSFPVRPRRMLTIILVLAAGLTLPLSQVPRVYSAELTTNEQLLSFLEDVMMLDLTQYNVTRTSYVVTENYWGYDSLYDATRVSYTLENNESKLDAKFEFADDKLDNFRLYIDKGEPLFSEPQGNVLERANVFLYRYLNFTGSDCQEMKDTLSNVTEVKNVTITAGNVVFELNDDAGGTQFRWRFVFNGAEFYRFGFTFRRNGEFAGGDTRFINKIGSTDVNVSLEDAIAIAWDFVENLTGRMGNDNPKYQNITLANEPTWQLLVRTREPMTYYPYWTIGIHFDETIIEGAAGLFGVYVTIWADTGEIISSQPMAIIGIFPPEDSANPTEVATPSPEPSKVTPSDESSDLPEVPADSPPDSQAVPESTPSNQPSSEPNSTEAEPSPLISVLTGMALVTVVIAVAAVVYLKKRKRLLQARQEVLS